MTWLSQQETNASGTISYAILITDCIENDHRGFQNYYSCCSVHLVARLIALYSENIFTSLLLLFLQLCLVSLVAKKFFTSKM